MRRELGLHVGLPEVVIDPHHLAGGLHLGAQHRVHARELDEREHRLLPPGRGGRPAPPPPPRAGPPARAPPPRPPHGLVDKRPPPLPPRLLPRHVTNLGVKE